MWVKLHVTLIDNDAFRSLSAEARGTFVIALAIAKKQEQGGALSVRGVGPMSPGKIAEYTGLSPKRQEQALQELTRIGPFLTLRDDGAYVIEKYEEKAGAESALRSNADRQRRHRERQRAGDLTTLSEAVTDLRDAVTRNAVTPLRNAVTSPLRNDVTRNENVTDKEEDKDKEISDPSGAKAPPGSAPDAPKRQKAEPDTSWVDPLVDAARSLGDKMLQDLDVDERETLARYHCLKFGNCTKTEARNKAQATKVAAALASMSRASGYGQMTVKRYVAYAVKVHQQRELTPWFDPWLIRAVVTFEAA